MWIYESIFGLSVRIDPFNPPFNLAHKPWELQASHFHSFLRVFTTVCDFQTSNIHIFDLEMVLIGSDSIFKYKAKQMEERFYSSSEIPDNCYWLEYFCTKPLTFLICKDATKPHLWHESKPGLKTWFIILLVTSTHSSNLSFVKKQLYIILL